MSRDTAMQVATGNPIATVGPQAPTESQPNSGGTPQAQPSLQSTRFAALAQKEAELVKEKAAFKREREQASQVIKQKEEFEQKRKVDPISAMKDLGFSDTDIFNYMASQEKPVLTPEERAAQMAVEVVEQRLKARDELEAKKTQEAQAMKDTATINEFKGTIGQVLKTNGEKYEYCSFYGPAAEQLAYETVLAVVRESKGQDVCTPQEALELVEQYYEEQDQAMSKLKKRQTRQVPEPAPQQPVRTREISKVGNLPQTQPNPTITRTRTLTNSATASVASARSTRQESRSEKRERLMEQLRQGGFKK